MNHIAFRWSSWIVCGCISSVNRRDFLLFHFEVKENKFLYQINKKVCLRRLACILRNPPEDDDEEQIPNETAIEAPPVDQPPPQYERERY